MSHIALSVIDRLLSNPDSKIQSDVKTLIDRLLSNPDLKTESNLGTLIDCLLANPDSKIEKDLRTSINRLMSDPKIQSDLKSSINRLLSNPDSNIERDLNTWKFLKASLHRDLEFLFNTTKPANTELQDFPNLIGTLLDFGVPEFRALDWSDEDVQANIAVAIERALRTFEPRLSLITASPQLTDGTFRPGPGGSLPFSVRAKLNCNGAHERIRFDVFIGTQARCANAGEILDDA